jgi:hypothetical protein
VLSRQGFLRQAFTSVVQYVVQRGSCPESLVARGQARLFGVAGSNPPGSVSTSLSDSNVSVSLVHACGVRLPLRSFSFFLVLKRSSSWKQRIMWRSNRGK